jgi:acetyl esterase/lipase
VTAEKYTGTQFSHPYASVLLAPAPLNHPPTHITVGGVDEIRDEGIAYAMHLRNAGIDTQLEIIPGIPHGINVPVTTHAARQFYRNQARVLKYAFYVEKPNPR